MAARIFAEGQSRGCKEAKASLRKWDHEKSVPVLVLPGWWVERTTLEPVRVLNPKEVLTHVRKQRPILSEKHIIQIGYQLERMTEIEF